MQILELRFEPEHWNAFAVLMQGAFDDRGQPIEEKVMRVLSEALAGCRGPRLQDINAKVEVIGNRDFAELWKKTGKP